MSIRIIACGVFEEALKYLSLQAHHPDLRITFLRPRLHNLPPELKKELTGVIRTSRAAGDKVICLYGQCFPEMDDFVQKEAIVRAPGAHCYEMFLGSETFQRILQEEAGTYFLEKELIVHFREYCLQPLELHDPELRECYFCHYKRLLYIRQPLDVDPALVEKARELADFLSLNLLVLDANYGELRANLLKLIQHCGSGKTFEA